MSSLGLKKNEKSLINIGFKKGGGVVLKIKQVKDIDEVLDFVYELSMKSETASYSRINTVDMAKEVLLKCINSLNRNLIAIYDKDILLGVFGYYWIDKDKYLQTTVFLIKESYDRVALAAIKHIKKNKEDYKLLIGVSTENINAVTFLSQKGKLADHSVNLLCKKPSVKWIKDSHIIEIEVGNFDMYKDFHDKHALKQDMYWDACKLYKSIDQFKVFCYISKKEIIGSIFIKKGPYHQEIFGLFTDVKDIKMYKSLLVEALHKIMKDSKVLNIVYFVDVDQQLELNNAKNAGFEIQDRYMSFEF